MPTYQYTCTECGEPVEAVQKFTDAPLTVCAACGGRLRKVFSPVGIVFKGSGFYRTDAGTAHVRRTRRPRTSRPAIPPPRPPRPNRPPTAVVQRRGSADKSAAKKSESAPAPAKSSSSSEKVA